MQNVRRYQSLASGAEVLESQLLESVAEHLNAEIVLRTVTDVSLAIAWLRSTFMHVRVRLQALNWLSSALPCMIQLLIWQQQAIWCTTLLAMARPRLTARVT